ncbi:MAG: diguanylate cyclase [Candidatus Sabulitectum sp.]|nr:diguanylate cyclase [Candidatus Sabulitectum sp.]
MKRIDVLLAMGSPALLAVTEEALLQEGLSVETATNGIDAVTTALSLRPRCVLCGQILAGLDGMKVSRFLGSVYSRDEMPVIISVPDINPMVRRKAFSASAVAVVDYSTSTGEIVRLVKLHLSSVRASSIKAGLPVSRDRIMLMVADSLENSLESTETVVGLASDMSGVTSISEACRKVVNSVLGGLGFQRVWVGLLNRSGSAVEAVAYRGRGITGRSIQLSSNGGRLPVDVAVSTGEQVVSWDLEFQETRETWVGSITYVDTPIRAGDKVSGIIRCDNGISRKRPSDNGLRVLKMLADELSLFIRYFDTQSRFDGFRSTFEHTLKRLSSTSVAFSEMGIVEAVYGNGKIIPGVESISIGMPMSEVLAAVPDSSREIIVSAALERRDVELSTIPLKDAEGYLGLSLRHAEYGGKTLMVSDNTILGNLKNSNKLLELETDAIASLAADLTSLTEPGEICRTMLRTLETFYPDEAIAVLAATEIPSSLAPEKMTVHAVSGSGYRDTVVLPGVTLKISMDSSEPGVVAEAVRTGRMINIPDVLHSDLYLAGPIDMRSELAIPMLSRGRVIGAIDLESPRVNRFQKDDIRRLNNVLGFAAGVLETALQQTELIRMASRDRLTGLLNMTFFEERYPEEFERAERYEYSFSLIMMDIDDFKHYNDSFGHPMGNVLLQKLTQAMNEALRDVDILVRYGGEEFVCILPLTDKQVAENIAERIRLKVIETSLSIQNASSQPKGFVSLSLGVATFPVDSRSGEELLEIADQRMYKAKRAGKNRVCCN